MITVFVGWLRELKDVNKVIDLIEDNSARKPATIMETGRRVSEVSLLKFECLEQDGDGDWLLRVHEKKLKSVRLIPISKECVAIIRAQKDELRNTGTVSPLLFPSRRQSKSPTISAPHVNRALNKLAISNIQAILTST